MHNMCFSPNIVLLGVLNAFLRCPPWCWMVCPPSRGLVSPCLHCLPTCVPVLGVSPCLPLSPIVSHCLPLSPIDSHCLPLSPHMCACVGCLPLSPFVSLCLPLSPIVSPHVSPHMCACVGRCVCVSTFPRSCLPLSPLSPRICVPVLDGVSAFASSYLSLSPIVSQCLPLLSLSPIASHCLPTCVPVLDGVFAFPTRVPVLDGVSAFPSSCLPLVSQLVSHCLPTYVHAMDDVPAFPRSCLPLSPLASPCFPLSRIVSLLVFPQTVYC